MVMKLYVDRMSQPSRALIIFCRINGLEFEEVSVVLSKRQHRSSEFKEINPMQQVPVMVDGRFKLFESHAILLYLAMSFPGVADHWYPSDIYKRVKIHSVLDWHHSNLRRGAASFVLNSTLAPILGLPLNPDAASRAKTTLSKSLSMIDSFWLKGSGGFLLGSSLPSIADLALACEIMQLETLGEEEKERVLGPHKNVKRWMEKTRDAMNPHFDEVHSSLVQVKWAIDQQKNVPLSSKL